MAPGPAERRAIVFKRVVWFTAGAVAGVAGLRKAEKVMVDRMERYSPPAIASSLEGAARDRIADVRDAVRDGRREMRLVSDQLESEHDPSRRRRSRSVGTQHRR